MIKVVAAVRRRPGMTHQEYLTYITEVHGAIATKNKMTVRKYIQNHVSDAAFGTTGDPTHLTVLPRDSVTELWFDDLAGLGACFSDPYTREVVGPDGVHFSDLPTAISLLVQEGEAQGQEPAPGAAKVLWFLKARDGVEPGQFRTQWSQADARAGAAPGVTRRISEPVLVLDQQAGGGADYFGGQDMISYDGLQSLWLAPGDPVAAMRSYEELFLEKDAHWLDPSRSFWLIATEHQVF
jgi:hypothetical protein